MGHRDSNIFTIYKVDFCDGVISAATINQHQTDLQKEKNIRMFLVMLL